MNAVQLMDYFRSQVRDDVAPYLWSDDEVLVYMNEAQNMFVRLTNGIYDVSSEAARVMVDAGQAYSALHPAVLEIRKAYYVNPDTGRKRELKVVGLGGLSSLTSYDYGVTKNAGLDDTPGPVDYVVVGEERGKVRWINTPTENAVVQLAVARLPLVQITRTQRELEVSSEHHVSLVDWMKRLAYSKQDGDAFDPKAAAEAESKFRSYCDFVWKEWERYRHTHKVVAYGGI
jgi:hypothetical protein